LLDSNLATSGDISRHFPLFSARDHRGTVINNRKFARHEMTFNSNYQNKTQRAKEIPDWTLIRKLIDDIDNYDIRNILRISYLYSTRIQELVRKTSSETSLSGNDFYQTNIDGEEALVLQIPTARLGGKPRRVAIPLNPKHEKWSKEILHFSEEKANDFLYPNVARVLQYDVKKYIVDLEWPSPGYKRKKEKEKNRVNITIKHLPEIREWELGLCHDFNEYDFSHFLGKEYESDYNVYFNKLKNKSDFYYYDDIVKAIELKNVVFNPTPREKFYYKEYMDVAKKIKRNYIKQEESLLLNINPDIPASTLSGGRESKEHTALKINAGILLEKNSDSISYEEANFDVVDLKNGIVVECGHTSARKLFDSFDDVYESLGKITYFWILQFYDENNDSNLYKFTKNEWYK